VRCQDYSDVDERVEAEHKLVERALFALKLQNHHWESNWNVWGRSSVGARYRWYEHMKNQADKGLPTARTLIGEVIAQRLKS